MTKTIRRIAAAMMGDGAEQEQAKERIFTRVPRVQTFVRIVAWVSILGLLIVTDGPIGLRPISHLPVNVERFLALAVVGSLFAVGYPRRIPAVIVLLVAAAGLFELMQFAGLGRHGRFADFSVKAIGVCCGVAAGVFADKVVRN